MGKKKKSVDVDVINDEIEVAAPKNVDFVTEDTTEEAEIVEEVVEEVVPEPVKVVEAPKPEPKKVAKKPATSVPNIGGQFRVKIMRGNSVKFDGMLALDKIAKELSVPNQKVILGSAKVAELLIKMNPKLASKLGRKK